ncbi:MAG: glycosyltransferase family 1 protein [Armatimonadota bacterium]|nr:glycosyltransferase family 1 protein [Armatimonadota bacterium]
MKEDSPVRLGIDGRELSVGVRTGIGRYVAAVVEGARRDGVEVIVYSDLALPKLETLEGVTVRIMPGGPTVWWDQVRLPRQLARDGVSVFLSPYYKGPLVSPCPVVLTIHDLLFIGYLGRTRPVYDRVMTWLARLYTSRAAAIITDSEHARRTIVARLGIAADRVTVIPLAVGAEFRPVPFDEQVGRHYGVRQPYVLYVGNFLPHKNLIRLVQAFAGLPEAVRRDCSLVLAGNDAGWREAVLGEARRLGVEQRVVVTGVVAGADLPVLYAGCEVFAMPSLDEGFGLPAAEAMACGAPVIASERASLPEVTGDAALLVDPSRAEAIGAALASVLSDRERREELRARSLKRAEAFRGDRSVRQVLALVRAVEKG